LCPLYPFISDSAHLSLVTCPYLIASLLKTRHFFGSECGCRDGLDSVVEFSAARFNKAKAVRVGTEIERSTMEQVPAGTHVCVGEVQFIF